MSKPEKIYREEGGKFRVRVLEDRWDGDLRVVSLECVDTLRPSPHCGPIDAGEVFEATCKRGYEHIVGWTLTEIQ